MHMRLASASVCSLMLVTLGVGCTLVPQAIPATDVDLAVGSMLTLEQLPKNPLEQFAKQPQRVVTLTEWVANDQVGLVWIETIERETATSIEARLVAERVTGVGEVTAVPEPIYETVILEGSLKSDALDDGRSLHLPSAWEEQAVDLTGDSSSVIWLSRIQYDELVATRHTELSLGRLTDALHDVATVLQRVYDRLDPANHSDVIDAVSEGLDLTEIEAEVEWGTYTLKLNDNRAKLQTIEAENRFAHYTILANPENPVILEVKLKAWAYGTEALGILGDDLNISGYAITAITKN